MTRRIENHDQAVALAYFLAKEKARHLQDVAKIERDLLALRDKWGIEIPNPDPEEWVEV